MDVLEATYGIIFQEFHHDETNMLSLPSKQVKFWWIIATMFLSMAFCGNLKSSFVKSHYGDRTMTLNEMIDKDLTIHTRDSMVGYLESVSSDLNIRILCQARKKNSIYPVDK